MDQHDESAALQELIAKLDPESRTFFSEAALGRDAAEFINSRVGDYLTGCFQQEYASAMLKLETVHWWRRRRIQQLQNEAWRARQALVWLRDLIIKGKAAELALEEGEET
jgi:hypothetical protein